MKVLYVGSEASPYSSSGGLGDVMGALPEAVSNASSEITTEVITPLYNSVKEKFSNELTKVCDLTFKLSWRSTGATIYSVEKGRVTYYFVENRYYFDREWLYGEWDDGERFAFFSKAVIEFILSGVITPDIIHANDWQSALSIVYLKTVYKDVEVLKGIKSVFSIHNIEYQGKYDPAILEDVFGISKEFFSIFEYNGCINLLKAALITADYVLTVSPNYSAELEYDYFSFGLSPIIRDIKSKFNGILNGIDYSCFSPKNTEDLVCAYDKRSVKNGKKKNKVALQEELGLSIDEEIPLIAMITRLTDGKGIDLLIHILDELLTNDLQLVILGTGDKRYEEKLEEAAERHKNFKAVIAFDRALSKRIYSAADIFLMPSKSEPCGLAQMIACAYGTVPIVHAVGGLKDTIKPYGCEGYNGFSFVNYNAHELLFTVKSALNLYKDTREWSIIRKNAMSSDFSWRKSAKEYIAIYRKITNL